MIAREPKVFGRLFEGIEPDKLIASRMARARGLIPGEEVSKSGLKLLLFPFCYRIPAARWSEVLPNEQCRRQPAAGTAKPRLRAPCILVDQSLTILCFSAMALSLASSPTDSESARRISATGMDRNIAGRYAPVWSMCRNRAVHCQCAVFLATPLPSRISRDVQR